jgi:hypothetical protein
MTIFNSSSSARPTYYELYERGIRVICFWLLLHAHFLVHLCNNKCFLHGHPVQVAEQFTTTENLTEAVKIGFLTRLQK